MKKIINIKGISNVKQFKKDTVREITKKWNIEDTVYTSHVKQVSLINTLYIQNECEHKEIICKELNKKLQGYKNQDVKNDFFNVSLFTTHENLLEQLVISKLKCSYCKKPIYILYKNIREPLQWTLDRINNNEGHNINNCVISCLTCNIQKKRMNDNTFRFSKQLTVIKKQ